MSRRSIGGRLLIVEPWAAGALTVDVEVIARGLGSDGQPLVLRAAEPIGWTDDGAGTMLIATPRTVGASLFGSTSMTVHGSLDIGFGRGLAFIGELRLDEVIPADPTAFGGEVPEPDGDVPRPGRERLHDAVWLRRRVDDEGGTVADLAEELGCEAGLVRRALSAFAIDATEERSSGEGPAR